MNTPLLDLMMTETDRAEGMLQAHGRALNFALQQDWTTSAKNRTIQRRSEKQIRLSISERTIGSPPMMLFYDSTVFVTM